MIRKLMQVIRDRKGAALVEYALLVAGVALVCAASVAIFGHKTNDMIGLMAVVMPGAHADDNGPILSGKIIETTHADDGPIGLDFQAIADATDTPRLGNRLVGAANGGLISGLLIEP